MRARSFDEGSPFSEKSSVPIDFTARTQSSRDILQFYCHENPICENAKS